MEVDKESPHTLIFYESPYRLEQFLRDALEVFSDRQAAIANDLTKLFESVLRGPLSELLQQVGREKPRGEYIVVIAGYHPERSEGSMPSNAHDADQFFHGVG